jgi:multicomponent Na+:H+ antiporter subunit F
MNELLLSATLTLMLTLALGLVRIVVGPTAADRMMAAQLLGTAGVGILLLLAPLLAMPALVDVGLVLALLAAVAAAAFTGREAARDD